MQKNREIPCAGGADGSAGGLFLHEHQLHAADEEHAQSHCEELEVDLAAHVERIEGFALGRLGTECLHLKDLRGVDAAEEQDLGLLQRGSGTLRELFPLLEGRWTRSRPSRRSDPALL